MSSKEFKGSLGRILLLGVVAGLTLHCSSGSGDGDNGSAGGAGGTDNAGGNVGADSAGTSGSTGGAGIAGAGGTQSGGGGGSGGKLSGGSAGSVGGAGGVSAGGTGGLTAGGAGGSPAGGAGGAVIVVDDKRPLFSFFITSKAGILSFSENKNEAKDAADEEKNLHLGGGLGGDLGGLAGADKICSMLAQRSNPGDKKVWHAFLSASEKAGANGMPVNAIDRIGKGPWYNFKGALFAKDLKSLIPIDSAREGRPQGGDPALAIMFTDEYGVNVKLDSSVDNHDTLTGSDKNGKYDAANLGKYGTCNDWTSVSTDPTVKPPMIGHSWPRAVDNGRHWISEHAAGGCGRGISYRPQASNMTKTVGAGGGYGGFYCFAVTGM
jgi:hypothetical protein